MTHDTPEEQARSHDESAEAEAQEAAEQEAQRETETTPREEIHPEVEVALVRSVRHGRIIVAGIAVGAILGMIAALLFPVGEEAEYTLGQIVGFMAVIGAAAGLLLGSLLSLILGLTAKRRRGAARAIQVDVQ